MSNPLVSICIPTHNRAEALRASLEEVRRHEYEPLDILISDNASTDGTEDVCRQAAAADARIRYVRQPRNIGLYGNHNFCLEASRGELLCFFHDHDERDRRMIRHYVDFLQEHPTVGVVCSDWELIDDAGQRIAVRDYRVKEVTPGLAYIEQTIKSGQSAIGIPGAMVRRTALADIRFDEQGPTGFGDFVVWFQVAERWDVGHLPRRLWRWRQGRGALSARTIESLTRDYEESLTNYCHGYLARWPADTARVARWRRYVRQYLFWALAYELGLHFRHGARREHSWTQRQTLFEILDYRLSQEQFHRVLELMDRYCTGAVQSGAFAHQPPDASPPDVAVGTGHGAPCDVS